MGASGNHLVTRQALHKDSSNFDGVAQQRQTKNPAPEGMRMEVRCYNCSSCTGAGGVEPPTARLTVECSAIELHPITARAVTPAVVRPLSRPCLCGALVALRSRHSAVPHCGYAQRENRTPMTLRSADFESAASTSSAIRALPRFAARSESGQRGANNQGSECHAPVVVTTQE